VSWRLQETDVVTDDLAQPGQTVLSTNWTPQLLATLNKDFERVRELWQRFDVAVTTSAATSSASAVEHGDQLTAFAHDLAAASLRAVIDHLVTWQRVISSGFSPTYAHLSLIRTAHESAWLAYWLMEPGIDAATRLARGVAAQRDDYDERRKIEEALGGPRYQPPAKNAADRLSDLMTEAAARGLTRLNKKNQPMLITTLLSAVELFDKYEVVANGRGSYLYRLYSGYAHGKQWALTQGAQAALPSDAAGNTLALIGASAEWAVAATQRVVNAMDKAVNAFIDQRR
jgi:hypothetical protein